MFVEGCYVHEIISHSVYQVPPGYEESHSTVILARCAINSIISRCGRSLPPSQLMYSSHQRLSFQVNRTLFQNHCHYKCCIKLWKEEGSTCWLEMSKTRASNQSCNGAGTTHITLFHRLSSNCLKPGTKLIKLVLNKVVLLDLSTKFVLTMFPCFNCFQYTINETPDLPDITYSSNINKRVSLYQLFLLGKSWMAGVQFCSEVHSRTHWHCDVRRAMLQIKKKSTQSLKINVVVSSVENTQISQSPWMHRSPVINTECDGLLLLSSNPSRQVCASCFFTVNWKEVKPLDDWKVMWDTFVFFSRLKHAKQLKWSLKKNIFYNLLS